MTIKNKNNNKPPVGAAPTNSTTNTTTTTADRIDSTIIPINDRKRRKDDALDWLRKPSNDLPSNAVSTWSEISMLSPDGSMRVVDTYSADQWHSKNELDRRYDGRYEGQVNGDPLDRSIHSSSGLSMRSTRNNRSNDNNNQNEDSSSGLSV
jgi:hypothetical protein